MKNIESLKPKNCFGWFHWPLVIKIWLVSFILLIVSRCSYGEISTDGTIGPQTELSGPEFIIGSDLGKIAGNNLFHSFHQFNIQNGESATFTGPETISNIISRVTGGEASTIDGRLSSEIPGADFYLINPSGIMFGPNASLDVSGSFHASTADYLKFGENGRFDATAPDESVFVTPPPSAFGFTSANPEEISLKGAFLEVPQGETISIIGGKILQHNSTLFAQSGQINMAAVGSKGEVLMQENGIQMDGFSELEDIEISRDSEPGTFGDEGIIYGDIEAGGMEMGYLGGAIYIKGRSLFVQGQNEDGEITTPVMISSSNFGPDSGGTIDVQLSNTLYIQNGGIANVTYWGEGKTISIQADTLNLDDGSVIRNLAVGYGNGGDIEIQANTVHLASERSLIYTSTGSFEGDAGDIAINAEQIDIDSGSIYSNSYHIMDRNQVVQYRTTGNAGNISISTSSLTMDHLGSIQSSSNNDGDAGTVTIEGADHIVMDNGSQIGVSSLGMSTGNGGNVLIHNAGKIFITGTETLLDENDEPYPYPSQIVSKAKSTGSGGNILIDAENIEISDGGKINARSESTAADAGDAGSIDLTATDTIKLDDGAKIETFAENGGGGEVVLKSGSIQLLDESEILSNVITGEKKAGYVEMSADTIVALNNVKINVSADGGRAGDIIMDTDVYFATDDLDLDISSNVEGNEGRIEITAPDVDISGALADLPIDYLDASQYIKSSCGVLPGDRVSRLIIRERDGLPLPLDDFQPSPILLNDISFIQLFDIKMNTSLKNALLHYKKGAWADFTEACQPVFSEILNQMDVMGNKHIRHSCESKALFEAGLLLVRAYRWMGVYQKANELLMNMLPMVEKSGYMGLNALILSELADIYLITGDSATAQRYFMKSIELSGLYKEPYIRAFIMNNIANMFAVSGYTSESMKIYTIALELMEKEKKASILNVDKVEKNGTLQAGQMLLKIDPEIVIRLNISRLGILIDRQYNQTGHEIHWAAFSMEDSEVLLNALQIPRAFDNQPFLRTEMEGQLWWLLERIKTCNDDYEKAVNFLSLALLAWDLGAMDITDQALSEGFYIATRLKNKRILSLSCGFKGMLYEKYAKEETALKWTVQAILHAGECYAPELSYQWYWQMGRLYHTIGRIKEAIGSLLQAMEILTPIQKEFFQGYHRKEGVFKEQVKAVYLALADLYLELSKKGNQGEGGKEGKEQKTEKITESLLVQARDVLESLKVAEIQNFFQDACIAGEKKKVLLQEGMHGTAILYPIVFPNSLKLLLSFEDCIKLYEVDKDERSIYKMVNGFYRRLQQPDNNRFRFYRRKLYDWLIKPMSNDLEVYNIHTLVIVPDAILGLIPFGALFDGQNYLIEKYTVSMIPGILMTDLSKGSGKMRALACGLSYSTEGFSALPHVARELEAVNTIIGGTLLTDNMFTTDAFVENISRTPFNVLHIATHGKFGPTPEQTFLVTNDGKFSMNALRQLVFDFAFRKEPVELMTLSCCQTATGDERSALGLAGTALGSGVKSALATLWTINDHAAYTLIKEFYQTLSQVQSESEMAVNTHDGKGRSHELKMTKARALQMSQKKMLKNPYFNHPFYWSPFVLIGNWL